MDKKSDRKVIKTQIYTITVQTFDDDSKEMNRSNDGFNPLELPGACFFSSMEIVQQMQGKQEYQTIKRQVIKD